MSEVLLGIDVGGTTAKGIAVHPDGSILARRSTPTGSGEIATEYVLALAADLTCAAHSAGAGIAAAGIIAPGVLDTSGRRIRFASNLAWRDLPLAEMAEERIGAPVALGNDASAAGLAEGRFGCAHGVNDYVHLAIGTGIGASIISAGRLVGGARGEAGEVGHMSVIPDGEDCPCGRRGCLDTYAAAGGMLRRYRRLTGGRLDTVEELLLSDDPAAQDVWDQATAALATAIVTMTMTLDPQLVVLGGGVAGAGAALLDPVRRGVADDLVWKTPPEIELSTLGAMAGPAGALTVALGRVAEPGEWPLRELAN